MQVVTASDLAARLRIHPTTVRRWLRDLVGEGRPIVKGHRLWDRWMFSPQEAAELIQLYQSPGRGLAKIFAVTPPRATSRSSAIVKVTDIESLPVDLRTRRYLTEIVRAPGGTAAQVEDASFERPAARTFVLWHEPSSWATRSALGLYSLDLELRRLAGVLPEVYPELRSGPPGVLFPDGPDSNYEQDLDEFDEERPRRQSQLPRPRSPYQTRLEIVDAAPGSLEVLVQAVGSLVEVLNSHGVMALTAAITLSGPARPALRVGSRVLKASALVGKRITIRSLRGALRALGAEPTGRYAVLVRIEVDGSVTIVIVDSHWV